MSQAPIQKQTAKGGSSQARLSTLGMTARITIRPRRPPSAAPASRRRDLYTLAPKVLWATSRQVTPAVSKPGQSRPSGIRRQISTARAHFRANFMSAVLDRENAGVRIGARAGESSGERRGSNRRGPPRGELRKPVAAAMRARVLSMLATRVGKPGPRSVGPSNGYGTSSGPIGRRAARAPRRCAQAAAMAVRRARSPSSTR